MNTKQMTLAVLIFFSIGNQFAAAQIRKSETADKYLTLPKPEAIASIEISKISAIEWYSAFSDGLAYVVIKENGKDYNAYINPKGEIVLKNIRSTGDFKNGLAYNWLYTFTISERPNSRNIRGYMNKQGKYVWLSPRAETYLDKSWIKENYVGLQVFDKK